MDECNFCHAHTCTSANCRCYFLNTGEFYVCVNCHRTQSNILFSEKIKKTEEIFETYTGVKQIFMELAQKFHLQDFIGESAYLKYLEIKSKLGKSTKSTDFIICHSLVITCKKYGIVFPPHKIFTMYNISTQNYVKNQKFLLKKKINSECLQKIDEQADAIFLKLDVFSSLIRKKLVAQTCKILKKTDFKILSVASAVYVCYKMIKNTNENFRIFAQFCRKKIGVKFYTIRKIIENFYKINFIDFRKKITSGSL